MNARRCTGSMVTRVKAAVPGRIGQITLPPADGRRLRIVNPAPMGAQGEVPWISLQS